MQGDGEDGCQPCVHCRHGQPRGLEKKYAWRPAVGMRHAVFSLKSPIPRAEAVTEQV